MNSPRRILASGSPRRAELLAAIGARVDEVRATEVEESARAGETPVQLVRRLAMDKAQADARAGELRLAADTVVAIGSRVLGKPADNEEARAMLRTLSGRSHQVLSGVALFDVSANRIETIVVTTEVTFAAIDADEIERYVATGEPLDKAGAYGIQGPAALFVRELRGSYSNVVGLPLHATYTLFKKLGHDLV